MVSLRPADIDALVARLDHSLRTATAGPVGPDAAICVELVVRPETGDGDGDGDGVTSDRSLSWHLRLDEQGGRAAVGRADNPTVVVYLDADTLVQLRSGALNVQRAIDAGRLKVRGDLGALARARHVLQALSSDRAGPDRTD